MEKRKFNVASILLPHVYLKNSFLFIQLCHAYTFKKAAKNTWLPHCVFYDFFSFFLKLPTLKVKKFYMLFLSAVQNITLLHYTLHTQV